MSNNIDFLFKRVVSFPVLCQETTKMIVRHTFSMIFRFYVLREKGCFNVFLSFSANINFKCEQTETNVTLTIFRSGTLFPLVGTRPYLQV